MLAVMVVAVGAPNAHGDSFTYTYTCEASCAGDVSWTTAAIPGITMATTVPAADLTATSNTASFAGCATSSVVLDAGGNGGILTNFSGCFTSALSDDPFALTDYTTPGKYVNDIGSTLVVTAAPEPSSVALMLLGVGLVFVMRKRGHQLAT